MLVKGRKKILASFFAINNKEYQLIEEMKSALLNRKNTWTIVYLYSVKDKEIIESWDTHLVPFDFNKSTLQDIELLIKHVLKTPTQLKILLQKTPVSVDMLNKLWGEYKGNEGFIRSTILVHQNILANSTFVQKLDKKEQWLMLTQNKYRTIENMEIHQELALEVFADFLNTYLEPEKVAQFEQVYGIWKTLIKATLEDYLSELSKDSIVELAKNLTDMEIVETKNKIQDIRQKIEMVDIEYNKAVLSEKIKLEENMKELLVLDNDLKQTLIDLEFKKQAIMKYFKA